MEEAPRYRSRCTNRRLWQKYRVYDDRLELDTRFGLMSIPFENIDAMEIRALGESGSLKGQLQLRDFRPALSLDWTNLNRHVVADRNGGWVHRVFVTPGDPAAFKNALDEALTRFRESGRDSS